MNSLVGPDTGSAREVASSSCALFSNRWIRRIEVAQSLGRAEAAAFRTRFEFHLATGACSEGNGKPHRAVSQAGDHVTA